MLAPGPDMVFAARGVGFAVAGRDLLSNVDLVVKAGEVTALVGRNGSGKSTLLKIFAHQLQPSTGDVMFSGKPLDGWERRAFAQNVAYLPQEPASAAGMTVRELVANGRYPWHGALGRFSGEDQAHLEEALRLTDTVALADRAVDTLSGGERQRAWIAMLVAQNSRFLLMDEPTSALDIQHQIEILGLVRSLSHEKGLGVLVVLHDINMAARFSDRMVALRDGRVIAEGAPAGLMSAKTLRAIYGVEMAVMPHPRGMAPLACPL